MASIEKSARGNQPSCRLTCPFDEHMRHRSQGKRHQRNEHQVIVIVCDDVIGEGQAKGKIPGHSPARKMIARRPAMKTPATDTAKAPKSNDPVDLAEPAQIKSPDNQEFREKTEGDLAARNPA